MAFKCSIGLHSWNRCKCSDCGKIRDKQHDYSENCVKCSICGHYSLFEINSSHNWINCKCSNCNQVRHNWSNDCEQCSECGMTRGNAHIWAHCKCNKCGKIKDEDHWWYECKCLSCRKTRNLNHNFKNNCEECSRCGKTRINKHDLTNNCSICAKCGKFSGKHHSWNLCVCSVCGTYSSKLAYDIFVNSVKNGDLVTAKEVINTSAIHNSPQKEIGPNSLFFYFFDQLLQIGDEIDIQNKIERDKITKIAESLIDNGFNINENSYTKASRITKCPLDESCFTNLPDIVELLIKNGAFSDLDLFSYAVQNNRISIAEVLLKYSTKLKYGTNLNSFVNVRINDNIPIFDAIKKNNYKMTELLIKHGANLNIIDENGITPLSCAAKKDFNEIFQLIIKNLGERYYESIEINIINNDIKVSFEAARVLAYIGDLKSIEHIFNYAVATNEDIDVVFHSSSEEFDKMVSNYFKLFNDCRDYDFEHMSIYEESEASVSAFITSIKPAKLAINKLEIMQGPISNNILHLVTQIKDKQVICRRGTFEKESFRTLDYSEIREKAKEILNQRCKPKYNAKEFLTKDSWH